MKAFLRNHKLHVIPPIIYGVAVAVAGMMSTRAAAIIAVAGAGVLAVYWITLNALSGDSD